MINNLLSIQEAYENMYSNSNILSEAIHQDIKDIMDSDKIDSKNKLSAVSKKAKELIKAGKDTGMESDKPVKGSSRAVFFPKDHKEITVDGVKTKTPTAVKIAFPGTLDKHHGEDTTLGQDQNELESDHYINRDYGVLSQTDGNHNYVSSTHESGGVLAPVFSTHPEHHHLEMGKVDKFNVKDFAQATKNKEFPKGLKLNDVQNVMMHHHQMAHGQDIKKTTPEQDKLSKHPWVDHAISMMNDSNMHPGDVVPRNMGIYTHPVTNKKHAVMIDYGFSTNISKKYRKARMAMNKQIY